MGWMISVGQAGAAKGGAQQALSMRFDAQGVAVRVQVEPETKVMAGTPDALAARQAQRVWQKVLSTVVGFE